jgi:hypothetical protein
MMKRERGGGLEQKITFDDEWGRGLWTPSKRDYIIF